MGTIGDGDVAGLLNFLCTELSWTEFSTYRIFSGQNFPGVDFLDRIVQTELFIQNFHAAQRNDTKLKALNQELLQSSKSLWAVYWHA